MNIVEYDEIREKLDEVKSTCDFLPDVSTDEGYEKSKRVSLDVGKLLTALEKKRKDKKAYFLQGGKDVDAQAKSIAAELEAFQAPHKEAYKEFDNAKKQREANRKAELESRVQEMRDLPDTMRDSDSSGVKMAMEAMQTEECLDFYEYSMQALEARNAAREALGVMYADKLKSEAEAVELEKLRAEKAKRDKEEHEENIRREAAAKAEREKAEAVAREQAAKQAQIDAEAAKVEAEKRAIETEKQAKINAERAAEAARLQEVERQAEIKRLEEAETAKREASKRHVGAVRKEAKEAIMGLGINEATAKKIILAIHDNQIPNVSIKY